MALLTTSFSGAGTARTRGSRNLHRQHDPLGVLLAAFSAEPGEVPSSACGIAGDRVDLADGVVLLGADRPRIELFGPGHRDRLCPWLTVKTTRLPTAVEGHDGGELSASSCYCAPGSLPPVPAHLEPELALRDHAAGQPVNAHQADTDRRAESDLFRSCASRSTRAFPSPREPTSLRVRLLWQRGFPHGSMRTRVSPSTRRTSSRTTWCRPAGRDGSGPSGRLT